MNRHIEKANFIKNTPKGESFAFWANRTGTHNEDGTVIFNDEGLMYCYYESIEDFANDYFDIKDVVYKESLYVGDRDDDGNITWHDTVYHESELDPDEDGSNVYTKPTITANIDSNKLDEIINCDAIELLELILAEPTLVQDPLILDVIKARNKECATGEV